MAIENRQCNECGSNEWNNVMDKDYPERRRERDRTIQTVYICENCGAEGRHFEHQSGGSDIYSGAFR